MTTKRLLGTLALIIAIAIAVWFSYRQREPVQPEVPRGEGKTVVYYCPNDRSITATFYPETDTAVDLILSDGRSFSLAHVVSASGARYADTDESIVFWNKGDNAYITEQGDLITYDNCAEAATQPALATYADEAHGFTLMYPGDIVPETAFKQSYVVSAAWRVNAPAASKGSGLVAIPVARIDQGGVAAGATYPLAYDAEVRVGVSTDVKGCYAKDAGYNSQSVNDVVINGVNFKKFVFADAAMMKYVEGESYRTIRGTQCFVIERFRTGSTYRDEQMTEGLTQAELDGYYAQTLDIVQSFRFTK